MLNSKLNFHPYPLLLESIYILSSSYEEYKYISQSQLSPEKLVMVFQTQRSTTKTGY
ncbi:hypothetical protein [aff. Roholtiella sp. LEGE 12411]|uniref:hypothetical protein n=1 Tax=aff. Roholtiella sp. LEGE 12411 TaxID=1828822 RepID=UPI00187DED05|nr:hypothetical protein [aff. Roholtiella sp. LEGE 12411]